MQNAAISGVAVLPSASASIVELQQQVGPSAKHARDPGSFCSSCIAQIGRGVKDRVMCASKQILLAE
jgi:hypothetical protein